MAFRQSGDGSVSVCISVHADLHFFLQASTRGRTVEKRFGHATSLKDLVESLGIPHTEIGRLFRNGQDAAFSDRIREGDRIDVCAIDQKKPLRESLQPVPDEGTGFIADIHLGRMARRLRLLGFDTAWFTGRNDSELLEEMEAQKRILLTRDRRLLMNGRVRFGCCVRSGTVEEQVREVIRRFRLSGRQKPFSRCLACNTLLQSRTKEAVDALLEPKTRLYFKSFQACPGCCRVYWEGSHVPELRAFIEQVLGE
jgi:uncharacterized protein with PIN domain